MTRRKPTKAHKPILCPACATALPPAFIRSSANSLAGSADRPGARGLVRNPTGKRKAKEEDELCYLCKQPIVFPADDDPQYIGDTVVRSYCGHYIQSRE